MKREHKYKAWNGKVMSKPFTLSDASYEGFPRPITDDNGECDIHADIMWLQFTGVYDKKGKEIFDGDVVRHDYANGEDFRANGIMVVGNEPPDGVKICGLEMFDPFSSTSYGFDMESERQEDVEVIGNIYENPELLTPQL